MTNSSKHTSQRNFAQRTTTIRCKCAPDKSCWTTKNPTGAGFSFYRGSATDLHVHATHTVAKALATVAHTFNLTAERLNQIIDGMEMDLTYNRYADFDTLRHYCYHVASVVGLCSAEIFGYRNPDTLKYAEDLGLAFQLTNIIRDVGEDARRDRIYLPQDELVRFGVTEADILNSRETDAFTKLMEFQIERAESYYTRAFAALPNEDRKKQRPGIVMAAIYRSLLMEIKQDGCHVLRQRVSLTPVRKLWIAWITWMRG